MFASRGSPPPAHRVLLLRQIVAGASALAFVGCEKSPPPPAGSSGAAALPPLPVLESAAAPRVAPAPSAPAPAQPVSSAGLVALQPLICFGNEPFWGVQFKADGSASCEAMCEGPPGLHVANVSLSASGDPQGFDLLDAQDGLFLRGVLRRTGKCSDGMSDNLHPYVFTAEGQRGRMTGCCRDKRVPLTSG
jgi:uncharacterized membrane protein